MLDYKIYNIKTHIIHYYKFYNQALTLLSLTSFLYSIQTEAFSHQEYCTEIPEITNCEIVKLRKGCEINYNIHEEIQKILLRLLCRNVALTQKKK